MTGVKGMKGGGGSRPGSGRKTKTLHIPIEKSIGFWYALDEYEQEFFEEACKQQGIKPTRANVLKLAKQCAKRGITQGMQQVYAQYKREVEDKENSMAEKTQFSYKEIDLDELTSTDLREEAQEGMKAFRIFIDGHAESADALYDPSSVRLGIAWGADATWADLDDDNIEAGIDMWLNNGEEWSNRN